MSKIMQTTMYAQLKFNEEFNAEFDFEETLVDHHFHPDGGTGSNHNNDKSNSKMVARQQCTWSMLATIT
jgi:hypothetical protein